MATTTPNWTQSLRAPGGARVRRFGRKRDHRMRMTQAVVVPAHR